MFNLKSLLLSVLLIPAFSHALIDGEQTFEHPAIGNVIKSNNKGGSGTLIAPNIVLTAAHVVSSSESIASYSEHKGQHPDYKYYTGPINTPGSVVFKITLGNGEVHEFNAIRGYSMTAEADTEMDAGLLILEKPVPSEISKPLPITQEIPYNSFTAYGHGTNGWKKNTGGKYEVILDRKFSDGTPAFRAKQKVKVQGLTNYWQCSPGDSGGPLVDNQGRVFAVNSASLDATKEERLHALSMGEQIVYVTTFEFMWEELQTIIKKHEEGN